MSKIRGGGGATLPTDVPWRAVPPGGKPIPKIHHSPRLRLPQTPYSKYALSLIKHPNPIGCRLANEAIVEAAGPDCIVPGQSAPIKLLVSGCEKTPGKLVWELLFQSKEGAAILCHNGRSYLSECCKKGGRGILLDVWPIDVDLKFMEPVGRELKSIGRFMDSAVDLMNKSFIDR